MLHVLQERLQQFFQSLRLVFVFLVVMWWHVQPKVGVVVREVFVRWKVSIQIMPCVVSAIPNFGLVYTQNISACCCYRQLATQSVLRMDLAHIDQHRFQVLLPVYTNNCRHRILAMYTIQPVQKIDDM